MRGVFTLISQDVRNILQHYVSYDGNSLKLTCGELDRKLYEEVNEILTRLHGKWKCGKIKAHVFPFDPKPLIQNVIDTGQEPPKNPYALFPTPSIVVDELLDVADIDWRGLLPEAYEPNIFRVLEPSTGLGAFADGITSRLHKSDVLHCVEIDPFLAGILKSKGHNVFNQDFLTYKTDELYDLVVMNPPFSVEGDATAYITHINHAWGMLRDNGLLFAIIPPGWTYRKTKKDTTFRDFVSEYGHATWILPAGTFKESGTTIETHVIVLRKQKKQEGYSNWLVKLYIDTPELYGDIAKLEKDQYQEWLSSTLWKHVLSRGDFLHVPSVDVDTLYDFVHGM
jgi:predicted RNA methylase